MYDECVNDPALALMALGVPFVSSVNIGLMDGSLLWGPNRWEMYQHRHACRRRLSFSLGALDIAMAWEIYLLKPLAQQEWATLFFLSYIRPCLSFSPSPFGISLPQTWSCIILYVFYHHLDTIEEDSENEPKAKDQASSKARTPMSPLDVQYPPEVGPE
jgi:hypothetical protein